jgi:hypothetical protein
MPHVIIREANGTFTYRQLDEASATGSTGSTSVAGIVTAVVITEQQVAVMLLGNSLP